MIRYVLFYLLISLAGEKVCLAWFWNHFFALSKSAESATLCSPALLDHNSNLSSQMATKWCTKLEVALKKCPMTFHSSNLKATWEMMGQKIANFDKNWKFLDCNSILNTHIDQMMPDAWNSIEQVLYCFSRSFIKFQGQTKKANFYSNWAFLGCNSSLNIAMAIKEVPCCFYC